MCGSLLLPLFGDRNCLSLKGEAGPISFSIPYLIPSGAPISNLILGSKQKVFPPEDSDMCAKVVVNNYYYSLVQVPGHGYESTPWYHSEHQNSIK
jgi:hypothetical protein